MAPTPSHRRRRKHPRPKASHDQPWVRASDDRLPTSPCSGWPGRQKRPDTAWELGPWLQHRSPTRHFASATKATPAGLVDNNTYLNFGAQAQTMSGRPQYAPDGLQSAGIYTPPDRLAGPHDPAPRALDTNTSDKGRVACEFQSPLSPRLGRKQRPRVSRTCGMRNLGTQAQTMSRADARERRPQTT